MTGAPKLRTVQILETLEIRPRGVYSGTLGFFSANGSADFSVVIRTVAISRDRVSVGAGGAIVAMSNDVSEVEEMELKAQSVMPSLEAVFGVIL